MMATTNDIQVDFVFDESSDLSINEITNAEIDKITTNTAFDEVDNLDLIPDDFDSVLIAHDTKNALGKTWEVHVLTIGNWPEFKTKTCYKWVKIPLDGKTKVPYPCAWRRTCKRAWYLRIVYRGGNSLPSDIERIVKDCAKKALIPSVPILLTGNVGGAVAAFLESFKVCLIAKGVQHAADFSAGFDSRATCGRWKRI